MQGVAVYFWSTPHELGAFGWWWRGCAKHYRRRPGRSGGTENTSPVRRADATSCCRLRLRHRGLSNTTFLALIETGITVWRWSCSSPVAIYYYSSRARMFIRGPRRTPMPPAWGCYSVALTGRNARHRNTLAVPRLRRTRLRTYDHKDPFSQSAVQLFGNSVHHRGLRWSPLYRAGERRSRDFHVRLGPMRLGPHAFFSRCDA